MRAGSSSITGAGGSAAVLGPVWASGSVSGCGAVAAGASVSSGGLVWTSGWAVWAAVKKGSSNGRPSQPVSKAANSSTARMRPLFPRIAAATRA